jgi:hypothetical protein
MQASTWKLPAVAAIMTAAWYLDNRTAGMQALPA